MRAATSVESLYNSLALHFSERYSSCMVAALFMVAERTQREKHHSYDLRLKLRAVAAAKKSIITADEQEFEVDKTINARFE